MFRRASWFFVALFGLALAGATTMNLILINEARKALDEGILGPRTQGGPARYHLGLVIPDTTDSFFDGLVAGVRTKALATDVAVQVFRYGKNAAHEAEAYFQLCLTSRLDGIVLFGNGDEVAARQAQADKENVVFIPVGTQAPGARGQGFIGSSSLLQGIESGKQVGKVLGRLARVGILLSSEGTGELDDEPLYRGVNSALLAFPGARVVQVTRARPGILSGEEAASLMLKSDPTINVLVCATGPITEGAAQVVVDQGRVGRVRIIGTDESPNIDRLVDKGVIAASVVRDSRNMGARALEAFLSARAGTPFRSAVEVGFSVRSPQEPTR